MRVITRRIAALFGRARRDAELNDEIDCHLDLLAADFERRGLSRENARAAARREFGGVEHMKDTYREQRGVPFLDAAMQDVRYALRTLRRSPGFTVVAVLSLTLGIGANTAIFSVVDALLLRTLTVTDPDRLAFFSIESPGGSDDSFSFPAYEEYRDQNHGFAGICASGGRTMARMTVNDGGAADVESVKAERVSGTFFSVLGVEPALGRLLNEDDDRADQPGAVAAISYGFWKRRFGLDPDIVGRKVTLNETPMTIVGVAPPGFFGFEIGTAPDLWFPLQMYPAFAHMNPALLRQRGWTWLRLMGRLRPGTSAVQARAEIDVMFQREIQEQVDRRSARLGNAFTARERQGILDRHIELHRGGTGWTRLRAQFTEPLVVLMIAVGVVLLIACANVANLLLARATARQKEIAVRLALGAGRRRIVQQLLTESLLLAAAGGVLGALVAQWGARLLLVYFPQRVELDLGASIRLLTFTAFVSALTGVLFGLVPALRATRLDVASRMKSQTAGTTAGRSQLVLNRALVVAQVALSILLLVGAGLFVRTLQNFQRLDIGFDRDRVITFMIDTGGYDVARRDSVYRRVLDRVAALPGVRAASLSSFGLLSDNGWGQRIVIPGHVPPLNENMRANGQIVGPRFFETMGTPIARGRDFRDEDAQPRDRSRGVAIVNEAMAHRFFEGQDPIGRRFGLSATDSLEIVGVVKDMKYRTLREAAPPTLYVPVFQAAINSDTTFLVRALAGPDNAAATITRAIRDVDPGVLVRVVRPLNELVNASVSRERFVAQLASALGLFALTLASMGLYALMSYSVTRRTSDIAIRMALGAGRGHVAWMVLREDMVLLAAGFVIGLPAAIAASKLIESLLFGVTATDPMTSAIALGVMTGVGLLAGYLPARRASRLDPLSALKCE